MLQHEAHTQGLRPCAPGRPPRVTYWQEARQTMIGACLMGSTHFLAAADHRVPRKPCSHSSIPKASAYKPHRPHRLRRASRHPPYRRTQAARARRRRRPRPRRMGRRELACTGPASRRRT